MTTPTMSLSLGRRATRFWRRNAAGYLFILPSLTFFVVFVAVPVFYAVVLAFQNVKPRTSEWVGLANFVALVGDRVFWISLLNTAVYAVIVVTFQIIEALVVAGLLQPLTNRWQTFFRAGFYLPLVNSAILVAMVWRWIYNPNQYGLLNALLAPFHLGPYQWLGNPDTALWSIIGSVVLTVPGGGVVLYSAAAASIPRELYEVAAIDGAGRLAQWRHVTLPLLKPTTLYLVVIYTIAAFQVFERVYIMTGGGPGYSTMTLVQLIYNTGFQFSKFGLASAQALVLFVIVAAISVVQFRWLSTDVEY